MPPGAWMFFSCECCVLSGRVVCVELIARSEIPTECGVSEYVRGISQSRPRPVRTVQP
jgi:hypothetical protein